MSVLPASISPRVEREKPLRSQRQRDAYMQQVRTANAQSLSLALSQMLSFAESIRPSDGHMGEDSIRQVCVDVDQRGVAALAVNFLSKPGQTQGISQFVPVQWREGQWMTELAHEGEGLC